jgi:hypothetical protein
MRRLFEIESQLERIEASLELEPMRGLIDEE